MNNKPDCTPLEAACNNVEGLNIYGGADDAITFINITLKFSKQELIDEGIDLTSVVSEQDLREFCVCWLREIKTTDNDLALIALTYAIKYHVKKLIAERKCQLGNR
jgi:hypothetical protein